MAEYVLFDLDGTLTDPGMGITKSVQYALEKFDIKISDLDDLRKFIGPPLRDSFKNFYGFNDEKAENAVAYYREYFSVKGIYENSIYDGIACMLDTLSSNGRIIILATSKPAVYAQKILEYFNINKYFTFVSGSELDGRRSKKSEVIRHALEQCKITHLEEIIMVGDREHDILGAKEVGIASIGVLYGFGSYEELLVAKADCIVNNVTELSEKLN